MALWFDLRANVTKVGSFEAKRLDELDLNDPAVDDAVSRYEIWIDLQYYGVVEHRYGDGPWELVRRCLEEASAEGLPKRTKVSRSDATA